MSGVEYLPHAAENESLLMLGMSNCSMDILLPPAARELDTAAREDRRRTVGSRPRPCPALYLLELQTKVPEDYANQGESLLGPSWLKAESA